MSFLVIAAVGGLLSSLTGIGAFRQRERWRQYIKETLPSVVAATGFGDGPDVYLVYQPGMLLLLKVGPEWVTEFINTQGEPRIAVTRIPRSALPRKIDRDYPRKTQKAEREDVLELWVRQGHEVKWLTVLDAPDRPALFVIEAPTLQQGLEEVAPILAAQNVTAQASG